MATLTLQYPISANRYWRAVKLGKGEAARVAMVPTKEAKAYKDDVAWRAQIARIAPITGRVDLTLRLFPARPQDWAKRAAKNPDSWDDDVRSLDLGNCEKVISDALNGIAWIDDKQHHRITLERMEPDEKGARVEVTIKPYVRPRVAASLFGDEE